MVAVFSMRANGGELVPPPELQGHFADPKASADFASIALHYLNELSARRRLTTVFPNEQSPFYGVQMNYVNVGKGNLTFLVRDLVRLDHVPIVFGRVYDSSKSDASDFGQGWKLSVAESLRSGPNGLEYVDASNAVYALQTDGARVWSPHPHITGITHGRFTPAQVVLEVADLTKTFEKFDNRFRLVEVRNRSGHSISLSYAGDAVRRIASSGGRFVDILRDSTQRIVGATDDTGRTVRYHYDGSGRLSGSQDLASAAFQFSYDDSGYLTELTDPRGVVVLTARFDQAGKPNAVASQYDAMTYGYEAGSSTLVTNAMQQAARLAARNRTYATVQISPASIDIEFDRDLHISSLTFDGAPVARAQYAAGRLVSVGTQIAGIRRTRHFNYDGRGRLLRVSENGRPIARYGYDAAGNVVLGADASGERRYRYERTGSLVGTEIDGFRLTFGTNGRGMIERVDWASGHGDPTHDHGVRSSAYAEGQPVSLDISYGDTDRVEAIEFNAPNQSIRSDFAYTARGFRESGRYDLLEPTGQPTISFSYDAVGNLTEWTYPGRYGRPHPIQHTVGSLNQVQAIPRLDTKRSCRRSNTTPTAGPFA
jgi:YD repeat-containing protein